MMGFLKLFLFFILLYGHVQAGILPVIMPESRPLQPETYLCTGMKLDKNKEYYVTEFLPQTTHGITHHILIYGCIEPGSHDKIWNCGEMAGGSSKMTQAGTCASGSQIMYAWAHNAPNLKLPHDVSFKLGKGTQVKYVVAQVHYHDVTKFQDDPKARDNSGVNLKYTTTPTSKLAGILLLGTGGTIKAGTITKMETACRIQANKNQVIHPFAFRTHTHSLGTVVSGYKVQRRRGIDTWEVIGKRNPQLPQMFYPIKKKISLKDGDIAAARCTMDARNRTQDVDIGDTANDEMCNFYLMYWVRGKRLKRKECFTSGAPWYYWHSHFNNIPDKDASSL